IMRQDGILMQNTAQATTGEKFAAGSNSISANRRTAGRALIIAASAGLVAMIIVQFLHVVGLSPVNPGSLETTSSL
ncbi:MAG: hypothetical protein JWN14_3324, partial [Chthonomonadales bacterium]|nr:hypothetical protein [Chthonomonadales bacterium]